MEDEANARLIAAAPDMAEALRDALMRLETIQGLIDQQGNEKLEGERRRYNWASIIPTIHAEADAGAEDARALLATIDGDDDAKDNAAMMDQINAV